MRVVGSSGRLCYAALLQKKLQAGTSNYMSQKFHTIIIGGGCLGSAAAISIGNRLAKQGRTPSEVRILEKNSLSSGLSARHSGIVRSVNASLPAAQLAKSAAHMWEDIKNIWGLQVPLEKTGALWIAPFSDNSPNHKWRKIQDDLQNLGVTLTEVPLPKAQSLCPDFVRLNRDETFFYEPGAFQIDPANARRTMCNALMRTGVSVREGAKVIGFETNERFEISSVHTTQGEFRSDFVINAAGPWSPALFADLGISIPVSAEPVQVMNWLTSIENMPDTMPIIADYVNLAYFRTWRGGEIHMHQPRKRDPNQTARMFAKYPLSAIGADFVNDPSNQSLEDKHIKTYQEILSRRFSNIDGLVFGSGYTSYFDITPDLQFILGPDKLAPNLIHCLGGGQAFKYTPVFGELMADFVVNDEGLTPLAKDFSISRFDNEQLDTFWAQVANGTTAFAPKAAHL